MIRLYHGSVDRIENPDCSRGRDNLDFGKGFYTTILREHAEQWARQVAFNRQGVSLLNIYDFDNEAAVREYKYLNFPLYDEAWMDFIIDSRLGNKPWLSYDFIEGGIANDRVIDTIRLYMYGEMEKYTALKRLSEHQPNNQICFLSQDLVNKHLHFVESVRI